MHALLFQRVAQGAATIHSRHLSSISSGLKTLRTGCKGGDCKGLRSSDQHSITHLQREILNFWVKVSACRWNSDVAVFV